MQKTRFIKEVAAKSGRSQKTAKQIIEAALDVIAERLAQGEKVTLTGFGTFEVRSRQARSGIDPRTRARIEIGATRTPGFSASSTLKEAISSLPKDSFHWQARDRASEFYDADDFIPESAASELPGNETIDNEP